MEAFLRNRNNTGRQRNIKIWRRLIAIIKLKKNILEELVWRPKTVKVTRPEKTRKTNF